MPDPSYITGAELLLLSGLPADIKTSLDTTDAAIIPALIEARSRFADSLIASAYPTPLTVWSSDIKIAVAALVAFDAMERYGFNPDGEDAQKDRFEAPRKRAEDWLTRVGEGLASLAKSTTPGPGQDGALTGAGAKLVRSRPERGFTGPSRGSNDPFWRGSEWP